MPRPRTPSARTATRQGAGELRIIGGRWRGKKLRIADAQGLRPTPDRVRETLFNWLMGDLQDARVLDLFAGSGALGLEALSRGAGHVVLVERAAPVAGLLRQHLADMSVEREAEVRNTDALAWLRAGNRGEPFDVVFLDPPYDLDLLPDATALLASGGWLAPSAWVYLERRSTDVPPVLPDGWRLHRGKQAGQVYYELYIAAP